jgi:hypothetical protein
MVSYYELQEGRRLPGRRLVLKSLSTSKADTLAESLDVISFSGMSGNKMLVTNTKGIGWVDPEHDSFEFLTIGTSPHLSPDRRYLAYNRVGGVIVVMDLASGAAVELTGIPGHIPRWAGDGRSLFYLDYSAIPSDRSEEADVMQVPIAFSGGIRVSGEPIFHLHIWHPELMTMEGNRVAIYSRGPVSDQRPVEKSARVGWWRNYGRELEESLPR